MAQLSRASVLALYRDLLRAVRTFPSKKRAAIRADIVLTMRESAALTQPAALAQAWEVGLRGLETMTKYTSLDRRAQDWTVTLDQAPLGSGSSGSGSSGGGGGGGGKVLPVGSGASGVRSL
jgi:hypothetical protein